MTNLNDIVAGLPGDVLANLIAGAITTGLTITLGMRGRNPGAEANIHTDQSSGQRIFAPTTQALLIPLSTTPPHITPSSTKPL